MDQAQNLLFLLRTALKIKRRKNNPMEENKKRILLIIHKYQEIKMEKMRIIFKWTQNLGNRFTNKKKMTAC